jgi:hypothetical protein
MADEMDEQQPATAPKHGLAGKDYGALFRSDREPRRIEFSVAGKPCHVVLQQMGKSQRDDFIRKGGGVILGLTVGEIDIPNVMTYLVGYTLIDCCLWTRPKLKNGERGDWQQVLPPEGKRDLVQWVKSEFEALAGFWDDLVYECSAENGFTETEQGNSPPPSSD